MEHDQAVAMFCAVTDAPSDVAAHVLEAHHWDLDSAVSFYLEGGGVGYGTAPAVAYAPPPPPAGGGFGSAGLGSGGFGGSLAGEEPEVVEVEDEEGEGEEGWRGRGRPAPAPAPAAEPPIELLGDDDDDIQVLVSSLGRQPAPQRRPAELAEDEMHPVGSPLEEGLEGRLGRRVRRNRRSGAAGVDRDLELLGERFGALDEFQPPPPARPRSAGGGAPPGPRPRWPGSGDDDDLFQPGPAEDADLPDDVDLEEQRMLLAALTGAAYAGPLPGFGPPRSAARALSPRAAEREALRQEQDEAYQASLAADRQREVAAARAAADAEAAARAAEAAAGAAAAAEAAAAAAEAAAGAAAAAEAAAAAALERRLRSAEASLPAEPPADDPEVVLVQVRLPGGGRHARRFRRGDRLQAVFDFVDAAEGRGARSVAPDSYNLVMQYPRRVFEDGGAAATLAEAGLMHRQEALFLELKG